LVKSGVASVYIHRQVFLGVGRANLQISEYLIAYDSAETERQKLIKPDNSYETNAS
jgi:hypothetical protein